MFHIVAAIDQNRGIGKDQKLPWPRLKGDMKFYREITSCPDISAVEMRYGLSKKSAYRTFFSYQELATHLRGAPRLPTINQSQPNAVIMGHKTWESLPDQFRPLPNRKNLVLSRKTTLELPDGVLTSTNLNKALTVLKRDSVTTTFVIGGGEVFREAILHDQIDRIYLTEISADWNCDVFFPEWEDLFINRSTGFTVIEDTLQYRFRVLEKMPNA